MANTNKLRRRIKSIRSTAQITKAMQMVAATKMRRAQNQALSGRPYSLNLGSALKRLLPLVTLSSHPLLAGDQTRPSGVAILTTDKSLCGALNTNLFRLITSSDLLKNNSFYTVGKKGRNFVAKTGGNLLASFDNLDIISFRLAVQLGKLMTDAFLAGEIGSAYIIYPHFGSTLRQEATQVKILPIEQQELEAVAEVEEISDNEFLFDTKPLALLDWLLTHFVQMKIYQCLLETKASEHSARMIAMQNATDAALELVEDLNLTYNQTRQDLITKELLEITTAMAAME